MSTGKTKIEEKGRAASAFLQGERRKALASAKIASAFRVEHSRVIFS